MSFTKVPHEGLFISEPHPAGFGNEANLKPGKGKGKEWTCSNWLQSRFHFSFAEYRAGRRLFGALRVLNDDLVQPHRGFAEHPHRNMEIVTYIVQGDLTHQDSMGTVETLGRGGIQYMSAGTGVRHSESNNTPKPLRFIQMWFLPRDEGVYPRYGGFAGDADGRRNKLQHLVSDLADHHVDTPVKLHQDVQLYASELDAGNSVEFDFAEDRIGYILCIEGSMDVTGAHGTLEKLNTHDAADIKGPNKLTLNGGDSGVHFILISMSAF